MPKKFDKLAAEVKKEYEKKGYSPKRAAQIGFATAAKVAKEKKGK